MGLESNIKIRKTNMKDIGKMTKNKEKEFNCKMGIIMKEISKTDSSILLSLV